MSDATLPLQKAIVAALKSAGVASGRIFDDVPDAPVFPYVSIGPVQVITESADCYEGSDIAMQIDGWSRPRAGGSVEVKSIGASLRAAIHQADLQIEDNRLIAVTIEQVRYLREPDGSTHHVIMMIRARTEPV